MRYPLFVKRRQNCARQSLSAPRIVATSYCESRAPRKCCYPLFAYLPFKRAQCSDSVPICRHFHPIFWGFPDLFFLVLGLLRGCRIEPHNPRNTPTKAMMNIASAILGGGIQFAVLLGSDNSYTTPFEIPFLIRSPFEGLCGGGIWLVVPDRSTLLKGSGTQSEAFPKKWEPPPPH